MQYFIVGTCKYEAKTTKKSDKVYLVIIILYQITFKNPNT